MACFNLKSCYVGLKKAPLSAFNNVISNILANEEEIVACAKRGKFGVVFTTKRIIAINLKGGNVYNKEISSIPYNVITTFCWETKQGFWSNTSKLEVYFSAMGRARFELKGYGEVEQIYKVISEHVLNK